MNHQGPVARVAGISHVGISVSDLGAARHFYVDVMGLTELRRPDFGVPGAWFRAGDLQLHVLEVPEVAPVGPGLPHLALHVATDDLASTVEALVAGGAGLLAPPSTRDDFGVAVTAAFVTDPDGNVIELTDVGPLTAEPT
jgi:catechol 2,3-dioxygenase-like lactoylglutathione lyase family enzyme